MANNHLEFSEVLTNLTEEETSWLKRQLEVVCVFSDEEYPEDDLPEGLDPTNTQWTGCRVYRDMDGYEPDFGVGFQYEFDTDVEGWGQYLWLYAEENGEVNRAAHLVQKFLQQFRPDQCWSLSYAYTCSKPRVGEFGGGAVFVTAAEIKWQDGGSFVYEQEQAFQRQRNNVETTPEDAGLPDGATTETRRYVLYDFDAGDLATTNVYDSHAEAVEDASELDNVIVVPLVLEWTDAGQTEPEQDTRLSYHLQIDGPLFRAQRELLSQWKDAAEKETPFVPAPAHESLLDGLIQLTDEIADQAHDRHGLDCLLDADHNV